MKKWLSEEGQYKSVSVEEDQSEDIDGLKDVTEWTWLKINVVV